MAEPEQDAASPQAGDNDKQVILQKFYVADASLEVPKAPGIFTREWKPEIDLQINTAVNKVDDKHHQVVLTATVTAKLGDDVAYIVEVKQAGVFQITGMSSEAELKAVLGAYCPGLLFPFARETVNDLVQKGGFPQFLLQPVNFDAVYRQHVAQSEKPVETRH